MRTFRNYSQFTMREVCIVWKYSGRERIKYTFNRECERGPKDIKIIKWLILPSMVSVNVALSMPTVQV